MDTPTGSDLSPFDAAAIVVALTALFSWINARFIHLPQTIGLTILGALFSAVIILVSRVAPALQIHHLAKAFVDSLDFKTTLLEGMLSFLLFAGAFQIRLADMRDGRWPILALATFGTIFSTLIVAFGLKALLLITGPDLPFVWCLVFGALISPTDPVAVIAILKDALLPPSIQATVAAESLIAQALSEQGVTEGLNKKPLSELRLTSIVTKLRAQVIARATEVREQTLRSDVAVAVVPSETSLLADKPKARLSPELTALSEAALDGPPLSEDEIRRSQRDKHQHLFKHKE